MLIKGSHDQLTAMLSNLFVIVVWRLLMLAF